MDRREWLGTLGAAGVTVIGSGASARDHAKKADEPAGLDAPMRGPHAHFCGIHAAKADAKLQFIAQHYCAAHAPSAAGHADAAADPIFQCVLFDGCAANAKLLGVEYLISDARYRTLPDDEKKYWHPHAYEVLGGGLVAPGMEPEAERSFMKMILTTWGKAWHTWPDPSTSVPLGAPLLIWSLNGDGQVDEDLVARRDEEFGVSTAAIRARRRDEFKLEVPNVAPPRSIDAPGRQWTNSGDDRPTSLG